MEITTSRSIAASGKGRAPPDFSRLGVTYERWITAFGHCNQVLLEFDAEKRVSDSAQSKGTQVTRSR